MRKSGAEYPAESNHHYCEQRQAPIADRRDRPNTIERHTKPSERIAGAAFVGQSRRERLARGPVVADADVGNILRCKRIELQKSGTTRDAALDLNRIGERADDRQRMQHGLGLAGQDGDALANAADQAKVVESAGTAEARCGGAGVDNGNETAAGDKTSLVVPIAAERESARSGVNAPCENAHVANTKDRTAAEL